MMLHWLIWMQTILEAADQLIFIIKEKQLKGSVEGSIPVLIKPVSSVPNIVLNIDEQVLLNAAHFLKSPSSIAQKAISILI